MQLLHCYDEVNLPFVIAMDKLWGNQVFLLNVKTQVQVPLIDLKDCINL